jgi:hypothetical protein
MDGHSVQLPPSLGKLFISGELFQRGRVYMDVASFYTLVMASCLVLLKRGPQIFVTGKIFRNLSAENA